jgi:tetratricopeptide (TPR) repeat protein
MAERIGLALTSATLIFSLILVSMHFLEQRTIKKAEEYVQLGNQFFQQGELSRAVNAFTESLQTQVTERALLGRATAYLRMGNLEDALLDLNSATQMFGSATAYFQRGQAYAVQNNNVRALSDYDRAAELEPSNTDILLARANLLYSRRDLSAAIADYSKVLTLNPDLQSARFQRGVAYQKSGYVTLARADFETVLASGGSDSFTAASRARLEQLGIETGPNNDERLSLLRVTILYSDGEEDKTVLHKVAAELEQKGIYVFTMKRDRIIIGEIRYSSTLPQARAATIKALIEQALADQGYPLTLNLNEATNARALKLGEVDIFIPPLSRADLLLPSNKLNLLPVPEPGKGPPGGGP